MTPAQIQLAITVGSYILGWAYKKFGPAISAKIPPKLAPVVSIIAGIATTMAAGGMSDDTLTNVIIGAVSGAAASGGHEAGQKLLEIVKGK